MTLPRILDNVLGQAFVEGGEYFASKKLFLTTCMFLYYIIIIIL